MQLFEKLVSCDLLLVQNNFTLILYNLYSYRTISNTVEKFI